MTENKAISPLVGHTVLPPQMSDPQSLALLWKYAGSVPLKRENATTAETPVKRRAPRRRGPIGAFLSYSTCTGAVSIPHPQVAPLAPPMGRIRNRVELSDGSKPKAISSEDLAELELQERALTDILAQRIQWEEAMIERNYQSRVLSARHLGPPRKNLKRSRGVEAARLTTLTQATQIVAREAYNGIPEDEISPYAKRVRFYESD